MRLTANHSNPEIREKIAQWLYKSEDSIEGNEEVLINEKLSDAYGASDITKLEDYLSMWFDENITLPKNLIFIDSNN